MDRGGTAFGLQLSQVVEPAAQSAVSPVCIRTSARADPVIESTAGDPKHVLLVEDDPGDTLLVMEAFERRGGSDRLHVVKDAVQAAQFLWQVGAYAAAPRPALILLDLNLPRGSGLQLLAALKSDPNLHVIPVVVLSGSASEQDVMHSYSMHASAFVSKPSDLAGFLSAVRLIDDFFLTVARLPQRSKTRQP